jgi:hypothetical protein
MGCRIERVKEMSLCTLPNPKSIQASNDRVCGQRPSSDVSFSAYAIWESGLCQTAQGQPMSGASMPTVAHLLLARTRRGALQTPKFTPLLPFSKRVGRFDQPDATTATEKSVVRVRGLLAATDQVDRNVRREPLRVCDGIIATATLGKDQALEESRGGSAGHRLLHPSRMH